MKKLKAYIIKWVRQFKTYEEAINYPIQPFSSGTVYEYFHLDLGKEEEKFVRNELHMNLYGFGELGVLAWEWGKRHEFLYKHIGEPVTCWGENDEMDSSIHYSLSPTPSENPFYKWSTIKVAKVEGEYQPRSETHSAWARACMSCMPQNEKPDLGAILAKIDPCDLYEDGRPDSLEEFKYKFSYVLREKGLDVETEYNKYLNCYK
jgi:hypothetical protein